MPGDDLERRSIDTIRVLAMDSVQKANAGHPGTAMALAPVAYLLYTELMRHNPADPVWPDRDRFVLSAGHACILQYAALHLAGYDLTLDDLKQFRQWGSRTPGHPEHFLTPGVETTTGPLGQGVANGVGFGVAERFLAQRYNRPHHEIVDHRVYAICSHGDPLGEDEVRATKEVLGWDPDEHFLVPDGVYEHMSQKERGAQAQAEWRKRFDAWSEAFPEERKDWDQVHTGRPRPGYERALP